MASANGGASALIGNDSTSIAPAGAGVTPPSSASSISELIKFSMTDGGGGYGASALIGNDSTSIAPAGAGVTPPSSASSISELIKFSSAPDTGGYGSTAVDLSSPRGVSGLAGIDVIPPAVVFDTASPIAQSAPVVIDVTDNLGEIGLVSITATQGSTVETIYDGSSFVGPYAASSGVAPITIGLWSGFEYTVARAGGWLTASVTIKVVAVDQSGNETILSQTYATSATPLAVGNYVPASGTPIAPTASIQFDVTDNSAPFLRVLVTVVYPTGDQDMIFNGRGFVGKYILSSRTPITSGFRFTVQRIGGWPYQPTIQAYAYDRAGNEGT